MAHFVPIFSSLPAGPQTSSGIGRPEVQQEQRGGAVYCTGKNRLEAIGFVHDVVLQYLGWRKMIQHSHIPLQTRTFASAKRLGQRDLL